MRLALKPWLLFALIGAATLAVVFVINSYRHRFVRSEEDLVALLPQGDATIFFANVASLREAGFLRFLSGPKSAATREYEAFVERTQFDYTKDLDDITGASDDRETFFLARGRFDWDKLTGYAISRGGACQAGACKIPVGKARWASLMMIQSDVIGLVVSQDGHAANRLLPHGSPDAAPIPPDPVWLKVSHRILGNPTDLPVSLRIFAISIQAADSVLISLDGDDVRGATPLKLQLRAECSSKATAEVIRNQLQIQTNMLKLELAHEHALPSPDDLTGLLAAGTFQVVEKQVIGEWPVRKELLKKLQ